MLVVVLEKIVRPRRPLDQLTPLEFVELTADPAGVPGMRDGEKEHVMKQVVQHEQPDDDPHHRQEYRNGVQEFLP
jgi:hypothetical protein